VLTVSNTRVSFLVLAVLCLALIPSAAPGQTLKVRVPVAVGSIRVPAPPGKVVARRDSLRNGAIIGAAIGAVGAGTFAAILCRLYQERGDPSCLPDAFRFAAIGGAIGAGAGLTVDAARSQRRFTASITIRF
jgi:hypothetical protein